jgi:hypothetical protein
MATESSLAGDWAAFNQFVETNLDGNLAGLSLEQGLAEFRTYQRDLNAIRTKIQRSIEQADRGELRELDDEFFAEIEQEFDRLGISE